MGMLSVQKWYGFGGHEAYDRAIRCYETGQYEAAIEALNEFLASKPDAAGAKLARHYLADSLSKMGDAALGQAIPERALEFFEQAARLFPNYADLQFKRARCYAAIGRMEKCKAALASALDLNPRYGKAALLKGLLAYRGGDEDEGMRLVQLASEYDGSLTTERFRLALESLAAGNEERGLTLLEAIAHDQSSDANTHATLGDRLAREKKWVEAAQEYSIALQIAPKFADVRCRYAQTLLELDQLDEAEEELRAALELNDRYADAWAYLGVTLRRKGELEAARSAFAQAVQDNPDHPVAAPEYRRAR